MKRYVFLIFLCITIVGIGVYTFFKKEQIPDQHVTWNYIEGNRDFEKEMWVEYNIALKDKPLSFKVTAMGIEQDKNNRRLTSAYEYKNVEDFYLENRKKLAPYKSFFKEGSNLNLHSYFYDEKYLASAHLKQEDSEKSLNELEFKLANLQSGEIMETTYSLGDLGKYEAPSVSDIRFINEKLYVMVNYVKPAQNLTIQYRVLEFDGKTLKELSSKELFSEEEVDENPHQIISSLSNDDTSPYVYFSRANSSGLGEDNLIWNYETSTFQPIKNKVESPFSTEYVNYNEDGVLYKIVGILGKMYLQKIESGVFSQIELKGLKLQENLSINVEIRGENIYFINITETDVNIYVHNIYTGKKEYESKIDGISFRNIQLHVKK